MWAWSELFTAEAEVTTVFTTMIKTKLFIYKREVKEIF